MNTQTATKPRSDGATKGAGAPLLIRPLRRSVAPSLRRSSSAFTLTEILIVIAIVVLLIALAVPAFNLITGSRSVEGARNQVAAMLGRARAQAIGLQRVSGVMFFRDARTQRIGMALVSETAAPPPPINIATEPVWLDLDDADFIMLPNGVSLQTMADGSLNSSGQRTADGYIGFNTSGVAAGGGDNDVDVAAGGSAYGGVILFDGAGRLVSQTYAFRCVNAGVLTRMGELLKPVDQSADIAPVALGAPMLQSQFGLVMFETELFTAATRAENDGRLDNAAYTPDERNEEIWLDQNASPALINRYTGTLVTTGQ